MSKFQLVILGIFAAAIVGGLIMFATFQGKGKVVPTITIWGTIDPTLFNEFSRKVISANGNTVNIKYVQKRESTFDDDLLEALATNTGPDVILGTQETLLKQSNKILTIPYSVYPQANITSNFVQEAELFLTPQGVMALPFSIDPMVMYWNRDLFTNADISLPPKYWDEFVGIAPKLTKKEGTTIVQSAVALGGYQNIDNAKDIINTLILQAGNPLFARGTGGYQSTLSQAYGQLIAPASASLMFYTQFADPQKDAYTWNSALPHSQQLFYSNKLAMYIGYASEQKIIRQKNPNLNFGVSYMPQPRTQSGKNVSTTFGKLYGFALLKSSKQQQAALNAMSLLTIKSSLAVWASYSDTPSIRRDLLTPDPKVADSLIFNTSALWARGWLDPDTVQTDAIYKNMIEDIISGRTLLNDAIGAAQTQIQNLYTTVNDRS